MANIPGLQQSAADLIRGAMRLFGALGAGEEPTGDEASDGLVSLNQMLDGWNNDGLSLFTESITDYPLTPSKQVYSLGPNGDFNGARPPRITDMSLMLLTNVNNPLEIPMYYTMDEAEWQDIRLKATTSSWPIFCYDNGDFPLRQLNLWPVPRENDNLRIYAWQALTQFPDLTTPYSYPPGYLEAIKFNLAQRMSPEYQRELSPTAAAIANQTLAKIQSFNVQPKKLKCDEAVTGNSSNARFRQEWFGIA